MDGNRRAAEHRGSWGNAWGAWIIWGAMTAGAFWFVGHYGFTVPFMDEWEWVPYACGSKPVTADWLWSQHCEHRMVLPRLIYLGLGHLTSFNFRAGAFYNVALLSLLSAVLMRTARRLRGRASLCDAFFPLALLHWAQFINIGWGFQLNFVTSVVLTGLMLPLMLRCHERLTLGVAGAMTACLLALGLCGAYGVPFLPPMAVWIASAGLLRWHEGGPHARRDGLAMLSLAAMPMALTAAVFYGLQRSWPPSPGLWPSLRTALQVWTYSLGPGAREIWPFSGLLVLGIVAGTLWQAVRALWGSPRLRLLGWGAVCYLGAIAILGLGIGFGRAFVGNEAGFTDRYMTLMVPLLLICYLFWEAWETREATRLRPYLRWASFGLMGVLVLVNAHKGTRFAGEWKALDSAVARDMRCGIPPEALAVRYLDQTDFTDTPRLSERMRLLQQSGLGPYREAPTILDVAIRPMLAERYDWRPSQWVGVSRDKSYTQPFRFDASGKLTRIDVQLKSVTKRKGLKRLQWTLAEIPASGAGVVRAEGQVDLRRVGYYDFATLPVASLAVEPHQTWALTLRAPADAAPQDGVDLPLFAGKDASEQRVGPGLRGFVVLARSSATADLLARRASQADGILAR